MSVRFVTRLVLPISNNEVTHVLTIFFFVQLAFVLIFTIVLFDVHRVDSGHLSGDVVPFGDPTFLWHHHAYHTCEVSLLSGLIAVWALGEIVPLIDVEN